MVDGVVEVVVVDGSVHYQLSLSIGQTWHLHGPTRPEVSKLIPESKKSEVKKISPKLLI